jgi:hypothetical protein
MGRLPGRFLLEFSSRLRSAAALVLYVPDSVQSRGGRLQPRRIDAGSARRA